nr:WcbI family polysaccharide biosynthesis putative acetyltransferase [uncultured Rhodopila sp.]
MSERVTFVGSCQASALAAAYNTFVARHSSARASFIDARGLSEAHRPELQDVDVVCVQLGDISSLPDPSITPARIILFPYVNGLFLWPNATSEHIHYFRTPMHRYSAFGPEYGDAFLNDMIRAGTAPTEASEAYVNLNIAQQKNVPRLMELCLSLQELRDEKSNIEIAPYIREKLGEQQLFTTRGHLCGPLFARLALQVFDRIGISPSVLDSIADSLSKSMFFGPHDLPVHPSVAAVLGLPYGASDYLYHINYGRYNFSRFAEQYVAGQYNLGLYEGLELIKSDPSRAIGRLREGLTGCPGSVEGEAALAVLLAASGAPEEVHSLLKSIGDAEPYHPDLRHGLRQLRHSFGV